MVPPGASAWLALRLFGVSRGSLILPSVRDPVRSAVPRRVIPAFRCLGSVGGFLVFVLLLIVSGGGLDDPAEGRGGPLP